MAKGSFIDTAVPIVLILIVIGFIWAKGHKHFIKLFEWIRGFFKTKKNKSEPSTYEYIDYQ